MTERTQIVMVTARNMTNCTGRKGPVLVLPEKGGFG